MPIGWLNPICLWIYMNQIENGATIFCRPSQSWALDFAKFFTCVRSRWLAVLVWPAPLYWYSNMNPLCQTMPEQNFRCRIPPPPAANELRLQKWVLPDATAAGPAVPQKISKGEEDVEDDEDETEIMTRIIHGWVICCDMLMLVVCSDSWQSKSMGDQGRKIRKKTWTCCATHGNSLQYKWKLEACQRFFEHDCRQEAMPTKRFAWGDWDTLRLIETFKSM